MPATMLPLPVAGATMDRRARGRTIIPTTTAPTSAIPTATRSVSAAMTRRRKSKRRQKEGRARLAPVPARSSVGSGLDCFLEILGDAEGNLLRRLDLDRLAGGRVAAHARRTIANLEDAEARNADLVALLEVLHDQTDELIEGAGGVLLGHARLLGQFGRDLG